MPAVVGPASTVVHSSGVNASRVVIAAPPRGDTPRVTRSGSLHAPLRAVIIPGGRYLLRRCRGTVRHGGPESLGEGSARSAPCPCGPPARPPDVVDRARTVCGGDRRLRVAGLPTGRAGGADRSRRLVQP